MITCLGKELRSGHAQTPVPSSPPSHITTFPQIPYASQASRHSGPRSIFLCSPHPIPTNPSPYYGEWEISCKKKKILPLWLKGSLLMAFLALGIKGKPLISAFATFGYRAVNLFQLISHPCLPASALLNPAETRQSRMPSLQQTACSLQ